MKNYDVIVVGGGHAGIEACLSSARKGLSTLLVTLDFKFVGAAPCNPSIGGPAKGIVVREIDALGGEMAKATDATMIQIKMLNTSKGPGVQCLRAQIDKLEYMGYMQNVIKEQENLDVLEDMTIDLIVENNVCKGVRTQKNGDISSKVVILTTGTYMESKVLVGHTARDEGPDGQKQSLGLSPKLASYGIELFRLKTGTPPRILASSIDYSKMEEQPGMEGRLYFSYTNRDKKITADNQIMCYLIHTAPETHQIIRDNLGESAMYGGMVTGIGPRYCPSIEDKIVRFADKERHQLFIEPESKSLPTIYLQGFSTSMPPHVQEKMVRSLPGLENAEFVKYAYAIEYDALVPTQLYPSLESKVLENLFCAGQINGTSGYEEAAGQGLIAGINASNKILGREPLILKRDESYIGLMIDDLVTKGTEEPYRLLTSRSEYRLLLRHDNVDLRLMEYGYREGLISEELHNQLLDKIAKTEELKNVIEEHRYTAKHPINDRIKVLGYPDIDKGVSALELLRRPGITCELLKEFIEEINNYSEEVIEQVEIAVKYEGYIKKQEKESADYRKLEDMKLPADLDYNTVDNLALEARQKLNKIKPLTIGQASRISGVNPADISILLIYFKMKGRR